MASTNNNLNLQITTDSFLRNKTLMQLNKDTNHLQNQLILSQQNNTQITNHLTHCNNTDNILLLMLSNYTISNSHKTYLQSNYSKMQKLHNISKQQVHQLNISYNQLQQAHDKYIYIYGKCDIQIECYRTPIYIAELQAPNHRTETLTKRQWQRLTKAFI